MLIPHVKDSVAFLQELCLGDILIMTPVKNTQDKALRLSKTSTFIHAMLYVGEGYLIGAEYDGVKKIHWLESKYPENYQVIALRHKHYKDLNLHKVVNFARNKVGLKHDFLFLCFINAAAALAKININLRCLRKWVGFKNYICSELISDAYLETIGELIINSDIKREHYEPDDFLKNSPVLKKISEYLPG